MEVIERLTGHLHPRLTALLHDPSGEASFWAEIAHERTPLIEPDPQWLGYSIATFVFALPKGTKHVVLVHSSGNPRDDVLGRIPGTNVCHAAYRCRDDLRMTYSFVTDVPLVRLEEATESQRAELMTLMREHPPVPDPHCREHFLVRYVSRPTVDTSVLSLSDAPNQSLIREREGVARGRIESHTVRSDVLGNERRVWVYTPSGYGSAGQHAYPVLVAFDGGAALTQTPTHTLLDNLIADAKVEPHIAVFIDNASEQSRIVELPCSEPFAQFVEEELIPWLRGAYRVSHDVMDHTVTGVSFGGLAAMWLGYRLPHMFGTVISQSASLWWGPGWSPRKPMNAEHPSPEWLTERFSDAPRMPVRFWMEIGLLDHPEQMLAPNRRMKAVLEAKGYELAYSEPCGGHDYAVWRGTLGDALAHMLPFRARRVESA